MAKNKNVMLHGNIMLDTNSYLINGFITVTNLETGNEIVNDNIEIESESSTYTVYIPVKEVNLETKNKFSITLELYDNLNNRYFNQCSVSLYNDINGSIYNELMINFVMDDSYLVSK